MECNIEVIDLLSRPPDARVQRQAFSDIVGGRHVVGGSPVYFEFLVALLSTGVPIGSSQAIFVKRWMGLGISTIGHPCGLRIARASDIISITFRDGFQSSK